MDSVGTSYQPVHLTPDDWSEKAARIRIVLTGSLVACVLAAAAFITAGIRDGDISARAPVVVGLVLAVGFASLDLRVGLDLLDWAAAAATHAP